MSIRDDAIPQNFVKLIVKHRPLLKHEPIEVKQALAYLLWVSPSHARAHKELEGHMSICYQELDSHFGRVGFSSLNKKLKLFTVSPNWWSNEGMTRGYKVYENLEQVIKTYMTGARRRLRSGNRAMVGLDGKQIHAIPYGVASKDSKGVTAKAWNRAKVKSLVPINLPKLLQYIKQQQLMISQKQRDLFIDGDIKDYQYRIDMANGLLDMAREKDGVYSITQRYIEVTSGRLYGKNINLATAPRALKQVALHGLWEYDIENCHYSILYQLSARHDLDCPAINHYLQNKRLVRDQMVDYLGITQNQAKTCLIAIIYGARFSSYYKTAIPKTIGLDAALKLYEHPLFLELKNEVTRAMDWIISRCPVSRKSIENDYGKWIGVDKGNPSIMAHLLQGVESKMLEAVRKLYTDEILLLQHDGFASSVRLDAKKIKQTIYEATGYSMDVEEAQIALSPDFGMSR